jgi:hypothetical protein
MKRILLLGILASVLSSCVVVPAYEYDRRAYRDSSYYGHRYDRYNQSYSYDRNGNYYYDRHAGSY